MSLRCPAPSTFQHLRPHCTEAFTGLLQQTLADVIEGSEEFRDQPARALRRTVWASTRRRSSLTESSGMRRPVTSSVRVAATLSEPAVQGGGAGFVAEVAQMAVDQIRRDEKPTPLDRSGYRLDDVARPGTAG